MHAVDMVIVLIMAMDVFVTVFKDFKAETALNVRVSSRRNNSTQIQRLYPGTCPSGKAWADQATGNDVAHQPAECSARGTCNRATGQCLCDTGFTGSACNRCKSLSCRKG